MAIIETEAWLRHHHDKAEELSELAIQNFKDNDNVVLCLMISRREVLASHGAEDDFIEAKLSTLRHKLKAALPQLNAAIA